MLSRSLRRTLFDPRYTIPPPFLLPWTAGLTTASITHGNDYRPPPQTSTTPSRPVAQTPPTSPQQSIASQASSSSDVAQSIDSPVQLSQSLKDLLPVLRAQRQIYISTHIYGKSYLVTQGDTVRLPFAMQDVEPGDVLRLNRALYLGSRDLTLKPAAPLPRLRRDTATSEEGAEIVLTEDTESGRDRERTAPHFVPHLAKDKHAYLDERLFVCRALVIGVESEPLRIMEKTKRRQRHVKHVKSKHRYTLLKISELKVRSLEELENGMID